MIIYKGHSGNCNTVKAMGRQLIYRKVNKYNKKGEVRIHLCFLEKKNKPFSVIGKFVSLSASGFAGVLFLLVGQVLCVINCTEL